MFLNFVLATSATYKDLYNAGANDVKGCCITSERFHEYCEFPKYFANECKSFCNQDPKCKGYYQKLDGTCRLATTSSTCKADSTISTNGANGNKGNVGNRGTLGGMCARNSQFNGCYVKDQEGIS